MRDADSVPKMIYTAQSLKPFMTRQTELLVLLTNDAALGGVQSLSLIAGSSKAVDDGTSIAMRLRGSGCGGSKPARADDPSPTAQLGPPKAQFATILDPTRYTEPASIWAALETGHVRLLKMSWLIEHAAKGGTLSRRQELPPEAFISVQELKAQYANAGLNPYNMDGVLPIIAISFCWDTAPHPDPSGQQLATVSATLKKEKEKYAKANGKYFKGFTEMGVFWEYIHREARTLD